MAIKSVKVWKSSKKEARIYVHTTDSREGCKYLSGNPWHAKGSIDGNLTDEEWAEAKKLAVWENDSGNRVWHTVNVAPYDSNYDEDTRVEIEEYAKWLNRQPQTFDSSYTQMESGAI